MMKYFASILLIVLLACCKKEKISTPAVPASDTTTKKNTTIPPSKIDSLARVVGKYYGTYRMYYYYRWDRDNMLINSDTTYVSRLVVRKSTDTSLLDVVIYDIASDSVLSMFVRLKLKNYKFNDIGSQLVLRFTPDDNSVNLHYYTRLEGGDHRPIIINEYTGNWKR